MKKLLMAAAIVCAAVISQAATVNWGISGVKNSAGTAPTAGWAVMAFYTELGAGSDAIVSAIQSKTAGSLAFDTKSLTVSFGKGKYGPADVAAAGITDTSKSYDFYFVVFNDADATKATEYAMVSAPNKAYSSMDEKFSVAGTFSSTTPWASTAVPEPTSGLLMLLGVAGLALRRRRA
ncbi:MAG: PEP-CTERM sorting domain-containing protein [Kiritimatiellae bacterium]|nr:PEP-CTERM sorting domain-containing protein [Kiritimatiellia bacterium]